MVIIMEIVDTTRAFCVQVFEEHDQRRTLNIIRDEQIITSRMKIYASEIFAKYFYIFDFSRIINSIFRRQTTTD